MKSQTALLLFSRSARAEAAGKKIFLSSRKNKKATAKLVDNAFKLAAESGLPWYVSDETSQQGNDFGENLVAAIARIFNKGYKKVIVIGNDCPALTQTKLQNAINELQQHDWVLGPTSKGGVYLMGLSVDSFNETDLKKVSWQSTLVFSQLSCNMLTCGKCAVCLNVLDDINVEADIISFYKKLRSFNSLVLFLINLYVSRFFEFNLFEPKVLYAYKLNDNSRRGPPLNKYLLC